MLAGVLREDGWKVVAKTTGVEATLILPDGAQRPLPRKGRPSILEQINTVGLAARLGVDAMVTEVMSVHTETRRVECQRILDPHLVLLTNFRVDHLEAQGSTREEVAETLSLDVPGGALVLVPEEEMEEAFRKRVRARGGRIQTVPIREEGDPMEPGSLALFQRNLELVRAAATELEVEVEAVERGLQGVGLELGSLRAWEYPTSGSGPVFRVVSSFAANDPESTLLALDMVQAEPLGGASREDEKPMGLLALRGDRGDRSLLWGEALSGGALHRFQVLFVHGLHAEALRKKLDRSQGPPVVVVREKDAGRIMKTIMGFPTPSADLANPRARTLFGFGNIGGVGERLVQHWNALGRPIPLPLSARPGGEEGPPGAVGAEAPKGRVEGPTERQGQDHGS